MTITREQVVQMLRQAGFVVTHDGWICSAPIGAFNVLISAARADLEAELESLRNDAWQPIETAPKDGEVLLVAHIFNDQIYWVEAAKHRYGAWFRPTGYAVHEPTHWMPLPAASKEK